MTRPDWLGRDHDVRMWVGVAAGAVCIIGSALLVLYGYQAGAYS